MTNTEKQSLICKHIPGNEPIELWGISDLHVGAMAFHFDKWREYRQRILDNDRAYIVIGGDMMNNTTRSSVGDIFEETMRPKEQKIWLSEQLKPLAEAGRILCWVPGNHERRSGKDADDDPLYDVACKLNQEDLYCEDEGFVKIQIGDKDGQGKTNPTYAIGILHGAGGGIYTGAAVNRNERTAAYIDGIDALFVGHAHKGAVSRPIKRVIDKHNNIISSREVVVIGMTSWVDFSGYAKRKMLLPSSNKPMHLVLEGNRKEITAIW